MGSKKKRPDYYDVSFDNPSSWPSSFLEDQTYSILRPLYDPTSPWKNNLESYLNAKARQLGGIRILMLHFKLLSMISYKYTNFTKFLLSPFTTKFDHTEMVSFLMERFTHTDPWFDLPYDERKRFLKKEKSKYPTYESSNIIETALSSCKEVSNKINLDLIYHIFRFSDVAIDAVLHQGYAIVEASIIIGSHYIGKSAKRLLEGLKFYSVLGNYARWDDSKILIFKSDIDQCNMFSKITGLKGLGELKRAEVDGEDYFLLLLVNSDLPDREFTISDWQLNSQLTILKGY